jgi:hypothetical protein
MNAFGKRAGLALVMLVGLSVLVPTPAVARVRPVVAVDVVDARGRVIGRAFEVGFTSAMVILSIDDHIVFLNFRESFDPAGKQPTLAGGSPEAEGTVYFLTGNCSGQAYAYIKTVPSRAEVQVIAGGNHTLYIGQLTLGVPPEFMSPGSQLEAGGVCDTAHVEDAPMIAVNPLRDLAPLWQPPFKIRFRK